MTAKAESISLEPYESMKDSGVEWVGQIPVNWDVVKIRQIFRERRQKVSDKDYKPLSVTKLGIVPQLDTAAKTDYGDNRKRVCVNDFVINSRSDRKGSSGVSPLDGSVSVISTVLRILYGHTPYIHHLLRSENFQQEYFRWGRGIVDDLWTTKFVDIKTNFLCFPSPEEQVAIANFLDRELECIDTHIERYRKLIELLEEKRTSIINQVVTKGLDPNACMKDSGIEWLGTIPKEWNVKLLKYIGRISKGQVNPEQEPYNAMTLIAPDHIESKTGVILKIETADEQGAISGKYLANKDEIIYSKIRPELQKACMAPDNCLCSADMYPIKPKEEILPELLMFVLLSHYFTSLMVLESMRVAMPKVNREVVKNSPICIPPKRAQKLIIAELNSELKKIDLVRFNVISLISKLKEYRTSLISAAVTGKIDVRNHPSAAPLN
ncbi:restriction endonuclease subunit S [bacterium]|nr:restriction endonuclease subunit S [bacterium]